MNLKKCFSSVVSNLVVLFCLISVFLFPSCEVGLGESVDTENPSVEITYPPNGSVIRGAFTFAGVCADDKGVSKVFVTVRKNDDASFVKEYEAKLLDGGKWTCVLNEVQDDKSPTALQEKVFPFADGKYEIKAVAIDSSNRQSDGISRTYEIDNTPPVFIISSPIVTDTENATEYGSIFKIRGEIADDHAPLNSMKVSVFDQDGSTIDGNKDWTFSRVDISGGTTVNAARYFTKENLSPEEEILYKNYINIYGENTEGDKVFTCTIEIEDSAKEWNEPNFDSKKEVVNKTEGNKTTKLYLNDSIRSLLMGADSEYKLETGGIKDILNGTTKNDIVLSILNEKITDTKETKLAFSLNKKANPIYSIIGYDVDVKDLNFASHEASKNQTVGFQVQAGLNGTSVSPETFKLYLFGPFEKNALTQEEIQKIYDEPELSAKTYSEKSLCSVIFDGKDYSKGSKETFTQKVSLPQAISNEQFYVFAASGKDLDNLDLQTSNDTVYGFKGIVAGTPPQITISAPDDDAVIKSSEGLVITGTASSTESKIKEVAYEITVYDYLEKDNDGNYNKVGTLTGFAEAVENTRFGETSVKYSCDVSKGKFVSADKDKYPSANPSAEYDDKKGQIFVYEIVVVVRDDSASESNEKRRIYLDNAAPVVAITNVDPVAEKKLDEDGNIIEKKINGIVTVSGKVSEKNLKSLVLTVKDSAEKTKPYTYSEASFEEKIDTTLFSDGEVEFTLTAEDEAETKSIIKEVYTIDQSTDKPVIKFSNGKSTVDGVDDFNKVVNGQNIFGVENNNKAVFNFTDDDGLEQITITLRDENGNVIDASKGENVVQVQENQTGENAKPENPVVYTFGGTTTALINYILPQKEGKYILDIEVTDVEYNNVGKHQDAETVRSYRKSTARNYIVVSESNFVMKFADSKIVNDECEVKLEDTSVEGTISVTDVDKIKSIERYIIVQNESGESKKKVLSFYKKDESGGITISPPENSSKVRWTETIPVGQLTEGENHFYYFAEDVTGNHTELELTCYADNTPPSVHSHSDTDKIVNVWLNSTSQTLTFIIQDEAKNGYASGIDSVKYSFKNGEGSTTEGNFARGASCDVNGNTNQNGAYTLYKTTFPLPEGESNLVTVTVSDRVGNTSSATKLKLKIDTNAPVVSVTPSITGGQVLQNKKAISVTFGYTDATSGIKCVEFSTDSSMKNNLVTLTGKEIVPKYNYSLDGLSDGTYTIYVRATDNAGNKSEVVKAGEVIVDTTAPTVEIKTPVSEATVNKTISFAGMVRDNNLPDGSVPVLWYNDGTLWKKVDDVSSYSTSLSGQEWTITGVDTTKLNNNDTENSGKTFDFCVVFTDKAGNANESVGESSYKLTIDQNADRPVIKFTNINLDGSSKVSSKEILGVISDDDGVSEKDADGISTKIKLYRIDSADYDDDSETNKTPSTSGNKWKSISVEAGTGIWTAKITDDEKEGKKHWYFYVIDEAGGEFCTKSTSLLERPYFTDGSNKIDDTDGINFSYDLTPPDVEISVAHDNEFTQNDTIFGEKHNIYIRAIVKEAVGMNADDPVKLVIGNGEKIQPAGYPKLLSSNEEAGKTVYIYEFEPVSIGDNNYPAGTLSISVTAKDAANLSNKDMMNITIDKDAPTVKIISPTTALSDAVSSSVSIKGIVQDDKSSIAKLEYVIPKTDVQDSSQEWKAMGTSASWDITFASGAPDSSDSLIYYAVAENSGAKVYKVEESGTENIYKVPVWFRVSDSAGNEQIVKDQYVLVDSEGGKPKAWINSPEEGATTSGVVTIYGGASDNVSVKMVLVQIDANNDGIFDANDATYINTSWSTTSDELKTNIVGSDANWYIPASGTNSWKLNVDTGCIPEKNGSKSLRIRVKAIDDEGLSRQWSDPVTVKIDSETPVIKNLKIVQYGKDVTPTDSTQAVTEREYVSGMYISNISVQNNGKWYLTGDVSDNQTVSSITFEMITSSTQNNIRLEDESEITPVKPSYTLRVPLKTDESGVISYAIKAKDDNTGEATVSITINIDSTSPSLYNTGNTETLNPGTNLRLKSMSKMLGTESDNSTVVNNNNYFTFGDVVSEAGSGLLYTAFYFERDGSSEKRVYNPMFNTGNKKVIDSNIFADGKVYINDDGLAALCVEDSGRTSEDSITLSSANANIRKGGLIKIAGGYSLITEVSGTTVKFSPTASTTFTQAELILAQVVDHKITESVDSLDGKTVVNDDGDGMIETINQIGSSYNWTASIDSNNIPDGPITVHVVAIDNAGNTTHGSIATKVENNRPRIAKVLLGTDLNGNGKYDFNASSESQIVTSVDKTKATANATAFGEFSYYSAINPVSGVSQSDVELDSSSFKVISGLAIVPEFVGGNGNIGYVLKQTDSKDVSEYKDVQKGTPVALMTTENLIAETTNKGTYALSNQVSEKGGLIITPEKSKIALTFWDSTDETDYGQTSQWAHLMIPITLMSSETNKPLPKISPFYWNSKADNSVYIDRAISGHIELEGDLESSITKEYGNDPKVSGKIKVQGTIYDDVRLASISASVFGTSYSLSTYSSGLWSTYTPESGALVESFTVDNDDISQKGHTVTYTMVVNTEKLSTVTGLDKEIKVSAIDWKSNSSITSSTQTSAAENTNYYKMDVVPYVTEVKTDLSEFYRSAPSVYARTAQGKYPVNENETISLSGYNLGTSPTVTLNGTSLTGSNLAYNIGESATSGELSVTVGSVQALNNINNNAVEYNQQPNGVNNNTLNDNIEFDVWQFKEAARAKNGPILQPHMKVGPAGQLGFSYANATLYFNMPGEASDKNIYGQTPFGRNFGGFTQNAFTYDSSGTAYGVALCPDTSGQEGMSANLQFFSGKSGLDGNEGGSDSNNNYYNQGYARRIENTSLKIDGSSITQNINRIQSPSMTTYTDGSNKYVYVAYYDELSRQVRFRVGSIGSSRNDIGMGLVDLAGSTVTGRVSGSDDTPKLNRDTTRDSISGYRTEDAAVETIDVSSVTNDVYVRVPQSYGYNHIYAWDGYSTGAHPGVEMPLVEEYYVFKMLDTSSTKLQFNNGSDSKKTGDLSISSSGVYSWNGSSFQKLTSGTIKYQSSSSTMPKYDGYKYCHVVAASGVSNGTAEYKSATGKKAGQYVSVGALSDGTAVMAWYDSGAGRLAFSYNLDPLTAKTTLQAGTGTWQNNSYYVSDSSIRAGTHVSMAVDASDGIHLAYYSASGGDLYYSYIENPKAQSKPTKTVMVDSYGSVGTYTMIDVARDSASSEFIPYISFRCESNSDTTASVKIAYPVKWSEGNVLSGVDEYDRYTGNWEVSVIPTDNTPLTDYTNIGLNKDWSTGVRSIFSKGDSVSKSWTAAFAVGDSTTVYGNGTNNPILSYAVSENGVLEMAQKK